MRALLTVPMTGLDAVGKTIQSLITVKVIPELSRKGTRVFFPPPLIRERPKPVAFSNWGTMGVRKSPYPSDSPRFLFLLAGEGFVYMRETWYRLVTGQGVFVPQNCPYFPHGAMGNSAPEGHWLWVGIHPFGASIHHCRLSNDTHQRSPVYIVPDERIFMLFREWQKEALHKGQPSSLVSESLLQALFYLIAKSSPIPVSVWAEVNLLLPELPPTLRKAIVCIAQNLESPCRLEEVAKKCGVSSYHLCRLFSKYLGLSPKVFVRKLRLKVARQMLVETQLSPLKVCQLVGYSNYNYFRKQFRRMFGTEPSNQITGQATIWSPDAKIASFVSKVVP